MPRHLARFMTLVGIVTFATAFITPASGRAAESRRIDGSIATSNLVGVHAMPCDDMTATMTWNSLLGEIADISRHGGWREWPAHT